MTCRKHSMPFGAEILENGWVSFRLWAPAAEQVHLVWVSSGSQAEVAMVAGEAGWYSIAIRFSDNNLCYGFRINSQLLLPDPAARCQVNDVHGLSRLVDPSAWIWQDPDWAGRAWAETVIYELHVGTFTPSGNYLGLMAKLDYLVGLGVTAIQLMPVADFPGRRNWGYDGVLLFAPDACYGPPDDLKLLVQTAHSKGLMVFLDVVYNHFGPEGNYLHCYAPQFFSASQQTPWGDAINFDAGQSAVVRSFFIHNALYWLEEYHFDGLRLDAVHGIFDGSEPSILEELATAVDLGPGAHRQIHLMLENDNNAAHLLHRYGTCKAYTAQWNDDFHHILHVLLTGETQGYFGDYSLNPLGHLCRCLSSGFAYQGEVSQYRHGQIRGEPSAHLPPTAFINFLQNHDQIGNRLSGERLSLLTSAPALLAATALLLLAPAPPLLFMGQEWGCNQPFSFFCDFEPELNSKVWQGRRQEFAKTLGRQASLTPNPSSVNEFAHSCLDWQVLDEAWHGEWLNLHHHLLHIRQLEVIPRLTGISAGSAQSSIVYANVIQAEWQLADSSRLMLMANLGSKTADIDFEPVGKLLYISHHDLLNPDRQHSLPPWFISWQLQTPADLS